MSPSLRHIPIRHMGSSPAHLRYLEEDPDLTQFLGSRPRNTADLLRRAPANARRLVAEAHRRRVHDEVVGAGALLLEAEGAGGLRATVAALSTAAAAWSLTAAI